MAAKKPVLIYQFEDLNSPAIWEAVLKELLVSSLTRQEVAPN